MRHRASRIGDELDSQAVKAGKIGVRLRRKPYFLPSFEFRDEGTPGLGPSVRPAIAGRPGTGGHLAKALRT